MTAVSPYDAFTDNIGATTALGTTAVALTDFGFTADEIAQATACQITASGQICRYAFNESTPVASGVGHIIPNGGTIVVDGTANIQGLRIVSDAASATVTVTLFR